ncbi:hypothetical protein J437_LFUL015439, partial [Ladona fulva]
LRYKASVRDGNEPDPKRSRREKQRIVGTPSKMNKYIALLSAILAIAVAAPQFNPSNTTPIPIIAYSNEQNFDGTYQYRYETGNGIQAQESGYLKNAGNPETEANTVQGSYSYTGPDGVLYTITYTADENGFRAEGAHLPTPPPLPEALARAFAEVAARPQSPQPQQQPFRQPFGR